MFTIDLNSDLGESYGSFSIGNDDEVLKHVTSVNIACGFHAGDPLVMEATVKKALEHHVAIGAHPGFPDLLGFGRRPMMISPEEARAYIIYQVGALHGFIQAYGGNMQHVKPHGALYNMAATDEKIAKAIAEGVYAINSELILMGLAGGKLVEAGKEVGLKTANEVFADRTYTKQGTLVSRTENNALIHDKDQAAAQILNIIQHKQVRAIDGSMIDIEADSICVHGDNKNALELVTHLKSTLLHADVTIQSLMNT